MYLEQNYAHVAHEFKDEYYCQLTKDLDKYLIGESNIYKTYILNNFSGMNENQRLSIRIPGLTVGHIEINEHNMIEDGEIYPDCEKYFYDIIEVNKILKSYEGTIIQGIKFTHGGD